MNDEGRVTWRAGVPCKPPGRGSDTGEAYHLLYDGAKKCHTNRKAAWMSRIATFSDWIDLLEEWRTDIGVDRSLVERYLPGYTFEAKYGELPSREILFGDFRGDRRWERVIDVPDQRMRDALMSMIVYQ